MISGNSQGENSVGGSLFIAGGQSSLGVSVFIESGIGLYGHGGDILIDGGASATASAGGNILISAGRSIFRRCGWLTFVGWR